MDIVKILKLECMEKFNMNLRKISFMYINTKTQMKCWKMQEAVDTQIVKLLNLIWMI